VYEQLEGLARAKSIQLEPVEIQDVAVQADPLWIRQIMVNLVSNAIKYTPSEGRVEIKLTLQKHDESGITEAVFAVTDNGPGIAAEHLPHLFDRFYRVDSGRSRDAGGVGLGLNIAQWAAESHGGRIEVESEVGTGTIFRLVLPI
ncbi:MAG: ATP-binding protein, partial [Chthonomonadales bacterium]